MSVRFSRATSSSNNSFLIGGAPKSRRDFCGWIAFENLAKSIPANSPINLHIETFLYGEGIPLDASPEEIAYIYERIGKRPDFLETRAKKFGEYDIVL